ncbi:hypothetical protein [Clostridium sp.]|uniref:hypothetical protein n=1 Tax=Clostridium sp. TaxID=1506 RepID=UPI002606F02C|nr:hypothetical protein [Clostridium sp.]
MNNIKIKNYSIIGNASNTDSSDTPRNRNIKTDLYIGTLNEASKYDLERMLNERYKQIINEIILQLHTY